MEDRDLYIDGLVQDCSNSIADALELLQSCTKPSICISCIVNAIVADHPMMQDAVRQEAIIWSICLWYDMTPLVLSNYLI